MDLHGNKIVSRMGVLLAVCVAMTSFLTATPGLAQPGRTFTPPPPPPPPPPAPPRIPTYTPPPPPPTNFSQQHMQNVNRIQQQTTTQMSNNQMQQQRSQQQTSQIQLQNQESNHRDLIRTQTNAIQQHRATNPSSGGNGQAGGNAAKIAAKPVLVDLVVVTTVEPNTQGDRIGLMVGDVIASYAGRALQGTQQLQDLVRLHPNNGKAIELIVIRNGEVLSFDVLPGRLGIRMQAQKLAVR